MQVTDRLLAFVNRHSLLSVIAIGAFALFFRLGSVGICDGSESYYPSAAREMVEANNYIIPQLNYQILFAKPIMIFWMIIAGYKLFGITALGARFFSAVFAMLLTVLAYVSARSTAGKSERGNFQVNKNLTGVLAALMIVGSPLVIDYARLSEIDLFFSAFLGFAFLGTLLTVSAGCKRIWPLIYIGLGMALLTKGPASLVIYACGCFFATVLLWPQRKKLLPALWSLKPWFGIPLMLLIALPWWVEVFKATDGMFPKYFFAYENFGRANGLTNTNPHYWFKYPLVLLVGLFPWSLLLPGFIGRTLLSITGRGEKLPDATSSLNEQDAINLVDAKRVALGFGAAVVTLFSLSHTQMEPYLLPAVAPLAVYMSLSLNDWWQSLKAKAMTTWTTIIMVVGVILCAGGFALPSIFKLSLNAPTWPVFGLPVAGLLMGEGLIAHKFIAKSSRQKAAIVMAMLYTCGIAVGVESGIEAWYGNVMKDLHYLCSLLDTKPGQVAFYLDCRSSVLFYVKRPVYFFFQPERLVPQSKYQFKLDDAALKFPLYVFRRKKASARLDRSKRHEFQHYWRARQMGPISGPGCQARALRNFDKHI